MAMDYTRPSAAALAALKGHGMKPDDVPFGITGKGALELIVDEVTKAIINEISTNAVVKTSLDQSLNTIFLAGVPVPTDGGTALQLAWIAATNLGAKDNSTGEVS